jgi:serine/threonine protein kinase
MPEIGQTISHYRIRDKLGQGGMGKVFPAHDTSLHRKVALKFQSADLRQDSDAHKRLLRDAKSAVALEHPIVCGIQEVSQIGGKTAFSYAGAIWAIHEDSSWLINPKEGSG